MSKLSSINRQDLDRLKQDYFPNFHVATLQKLHKFISDKLSTSNASQTTLLLFVIVHFSDLLTTAQISSAWFTRKTALKSALMSSAMTDRRRVNVECICRDDVEMG